MEAESFRQRFLQEGSTRSARVVSIGEMGEYSLWTRRRGPRPWPSSASGPLPRRQTCVLVLEVMQVVGCERGGGHCWPVQVALHQGAAELGELVALRLGEDPAAVVVA